MSTTERVYKTHKVIKLSFENVTSDRTLSDGNGKVYFDLSDVNWQRLVVEVNIRALSGTSVVFKGITTNDQNNAGATTDVAALMGDATTAFASTSITGTGRTAFSTTKAAADGSAASNIGKYIGFWADVSSISDLDGELYLLVEGQ